jgi:hypothetical protein
MDLTYQAQLRRPEWKSLKQRITKERHNTCEDCGRLFVRLNDLQLHHKYYDTARHAWEYPDDCFKLLCADCHENTTQALRSMLYCMGRFSGDQIVEIGNAITNACVDTENPHKVHNWLICCLSDMQNVKLLINDEEVAV